MQLDNQTEPGMQDEPQNVIRVAPVTPYYSYIFIACLIAVFGAQIYVDSIQSVVFGGNRSAMVAGFSKPAFIAGEYWRVLTGAALHGGIIHLAFNCYALFILGKLIEMLSNRAHLAIVFLLSAIGGNLLSFAVNPDGISVGASGGIIGFLGYLTVYGFYRRKVMTSALLKNMLYNVAFMTIVGFSLASKIDNFAHLGGLIVGAIYGFIQIPRDLYKDPRKASETIELLGVGALGIFIFVAVLTILLLLEIVRF